MVQRIWGEDVHVSIHNPARQGPAFVQGSRRGPPSQVLRHDVARRSTASGNRSVEALVIQRPTDIESQFDYWQFPLVPPPAIPIGFKVGFRVLLSLAPDSSPVSMTLSVCYPLSGGCGILSDSEVTIREDGQMSLFVADTQMSAEAIAAVFGFDARSVVVDAIILNSTGARTEAYIEGIEVYSF
jgi:hypothetical protein